MSGIEFITRLLQEKVIDDDLFRDINNKISSQPNIEVEKIAKVLIDQKVITPWQAEAVQKGQVQLLVDKYILLEEIGEGMSGRVYLAKNRFMNNQVAIKILLPEHISDEESTKRFIREAQLAATLSHPNIVTVHDGVAEPDRYYLVTEYASGKTLKEFCEVEEQPPIAWVCKCISQVAEGLQHAHERGLVHRDIKPGNLILTNTGTEMDPVVKILDFGMARPSEATLDKLRITRPDQVLGTPDYMSPDQAQHPSSVDIRADIYSLGITMYHLLTGALPFAGKNAIQKIMAHTSQTPKSVSEHRPQVPASLNDLVLKMFAKNPDERYDEPITVKEALEPFCLE